MPMQFENPSNPDAHRGSTAVEIKEAIEELNQHFTAFIAPAGTGGTITGTGETLKSFFPDLTVHVVEPKGSPVLSGGKPGKHKLVGTSPGFIPPILNQKVYDEIVQVNDEDAYTITRRLASEEGILVGPSSGAAVYAALKIAEKRKKVMWSSASHVTLENAIYQAIYFSLNKNKASQSSTRDAFILYGPVK